MKIITKLTLAFFSIALIVLIVGYFSVNQSQKIFKKNIGENYVRLASETMDKIDRAIYRRIEQLQVYSRGIAHDRELIGSNREFSAMGARLRGEGESASKWDRVQDYIDEMDKAWRAAPEGTITPFMEKLINNGLSDKIREEVKSEDFYKKKYGHALYGEVFVTNKYGVNIAQTNKTSDYYQADEKWWQEAKKDGFYAGDVEYDKSAHMHSIPIAIRIDDRRGGFAGVLKAVLDIREIIGIIKGLESSSQNLKAEPEGTLHFKLITKEGKIIFSSDDFEFFEDIFAKLLPRFLPGGEKEDYFIARGDEADIEQEFYTHAHSKGYKDFKGLGWIVVVEQDIADMFRPVNRLKNIILLVSLSSAMMAVLLGFFISHLISEPIMRLREAAIRAGKGKLDAGVEIKTNDEIEDLADSFNNMIAAVRDKQKETMLAKLEVERFAETLESKVKERTEELTKTKDATLNIMEDLHEAYDNLKKAQNQLLQAEKSKAVAQLASGVAHEVKNPLGIVLQGISYLEKALLSKNKISKEKDIPALLGMMKNSIKRADSIVRGLVDFSRISKMDTRPESINDILESSLLLVKHELEIEKIEVTKELEEGLPKVLADKVRLEQVFINIFLNAIQAMSNGGKLFVRSYLAKLDALGNGTGRRATDYLGLGETVVVAEIEDTGSGISKEHMDKVFDPFFTTKGVGKGTGMGLSVTRNIVETHKGAIELKSEKGKGTRVIVKLKALGES